MQIFKSFSLNCVKFIEFISDRIKNVILFPIKLGKRAAVMDELLFIKFRELLAKAV